MDKEKILQMSRKENEGKESEWEKSVAYQAGKAARIIGLTICVLLVLLDDLYLHTRIVGMVLWIVFFSMEAASDLIYYLNDRKTSTLVWFAVSLICDIADIVMLIILCVARYGR